MSFMMIKPKVRGFICTSAHPLGCHQSVLEQIEHVRDQARIKGPKNVLVIGSSTGYGLASRIATTFGSHAKTIGVFFEKEPSEKRTATAGWYNTAAFEKEAHKKGYYAKSINGDAFSNEIKHQVVELIKKDLSTIDLVVYSLASPRRTHPDTGQIYSSVLKPINQSYTNKTVDPIRGQLKEISLEPATQDEIDQTVAVMGGDDWKLWMDLLYKEGLLSEGAMTVAYTYIGPEITHPIYKDGTIGRAKDHLYQTAQQIQQDLTSIHGKAFLSVNKAIVTQASAAIPVVPLYISLLYKVMKSKGTHENCIEQIYRMFADKIYVDNGPVVDSEGRIRVDDLEMEDGTQQQVAKLWQEVTQENLEQVSDLQGYRDDFYRLFGFGIEDVNYEEEVDPDVKIESIES